MYVLIFRCMHGLIDDFIDKYLNKINVWLDRWRDRNIDESDKYFFCING